MAFLSIQGLINPKTVRFLLIQDPNQCIYLDPIKCIVVWLLVEHRLLYKQPNWQINRHYH